MTTAATRQNIQLLHKRYENMSSIRAPWERQWQDIRDYVHPNSEDIVGRGTRGEPLTEQMFDATAPWALTQLASALHSFLTSPVERWFNLRVSDFDEETDEEVKQWLEDVSNIIYDTYQETDTNFNGAVHEVYQDLGSFGTSVLYQEWDWKNQQIVFNAFPLASCYIDENARGRIDTVFREIEMTGRQIEQEFPNHGSDKIKKEKDGSKKWKVIHAVFPRTDRDLDSAHAVNKAFASIYFSKEADVILRESGFDWFPYIVPRWTKRSGEVYGRSPGMVCLPDIKMVNAMEYYGLKAIQKVVDPPLLVPDDGFLAPIDTRPGALITYETDTADVSSIAPLETRARIDVNEEKLEQKRQQILRCFYADWIQRFRKKERQSVVEVMDDRDENLRLMAPIIGRIQTEMLGPQLMQTYFLLNRRGRIPLAPSSVQGRKLKLVYVSPAATAQTSSAGQQVVRFIESVAPIAQLDPSVLDKISFDDVVEVLGNSQNIPRRIFRTLKDILALREARNQQQQLQQMAETAEPASQAIKNVADARSEESAGNVLAL